MFDYTKTEIVVGAFVLLGLAALGYLSISIGGLRTSPRDAYHVSARFSNIGDLKIGAPVKIAGVTIGRVDVIRLADYYGEARFAIVRDVALPKDTIASVATAGLLGDAYVALTPGGAELNLKDGDRIAHTEAALNMADIIGRTAFGGSTPAAAPPAPAGDAPGATGRLTPAQDPLP